MNQRKSIRNLYKLHFFTNQLYYSMWYEYQIKYSFTLYYINILQN